MYMPFINCKITCKMKEEKEKNVKKELGNAIELIAGKKQEYLMIGFEENYKLYYGGKKVDDGAFVEVKLMGNPSKEEYKKVTYEITDILNKELAIPKTNIYVVYHVIETWGWNGEI